MPPVPVAARRDHHRQARDFARRQLVRVAVTSNTTAEWIAGKVTEALISRLLVRGARLLFQRYRDGFIETHYQFVAYLQ
jgi:hypothetical protein